MTAYIIRRFLHMIPILLGVVVLLFILFKMIVDPEITSRRSAAR